MIILSIFVFALIIAFLLKGNYVIIYLPVVLFIAEIIYPLIYSTEDYQTSTQIKLIFFTYIFSILIFLRILITTNSYKSIFVFTPAIFLLIALLNSSDIWAGIKQVIRISFTLLAFPAYYNYFKRNSNFEKYLNSIIVFAIMFITLIVICSIFRIGTYWNYGEKRIGGIYFFGITLWGLYSLAYAAMFLFFLKDVFKLNRILTGSIFYFILLILLLIFKRGLLIPMVLTFLFYYSYNIKKLNFFNISVGLLITYFLISTFIDFIQISISTRKNILNANSYIEEGRTQEIIIYFKYYLKEFDFWKILIGQDFFNSGGKFEIIQKALLDNYRILHSDLSNLLYTTGFIGTTLFYSYFIILYRKLKYIRKTKNSMRFLILAFFISLIFKQTVEGIDIPLNYFIPLSILGALLGHTERKIFDQNRNYLIVQ